MTEKQRKTPFFDQIKQGILRVLLTDLAKKMTPKCLVSFFGLYNVRKVSRETQKGLCKICQKMIVF